MAEQSTETPVLDTIAAMTAASFENTSLEPDALMIARFAALAAVDAPPISYLVNLGIEEDKGGLDVETVQGVLTAIAPIVGTARVASAAGNIARALGLAVAFADQELSE